MDETILDEIVPNETAPNEPVPAQGNNGNVIVYFSAPACEACAEAEKVLKALPVSALTIQRYSLGDLDQIKRIKWYFEAYHVPDGEQQAPVVFFGNRWISGGKEIVEGLPEAVRSGEIANTRVMPEADAAVLPDSPNRLEVAGKSGETALDGVDYRLGGILATGLLNVLNPCSLAMMLFFLSLLAFGPNGVLRAGLLFAFGKFTGFCLLGIVFLQVLSQVRISSMETLFKWIVLVTAVVMVVLNLRDSHATRKEAYQSVRLQLPRKLRGLNHRWLKKAAALEGTPLFGGACFGFGMAVSVGDFLCTGQIYLATILYVMKANPQVDGHALVVFLLYGVAFVLPLIVLTLLIQRGRAVLDVSERIRRHMPAIKLANACFFALFGVWAAVGLL